MLGFFDRFRHGRLRELLSSYIDDEVSDSERRLIETHLSECEECRQELESLRLTVSALRQLPEIQATRSFALSVEPKPMRSSPGWALGVRLAASAAAVVLVGLILADVTGLIVQSDLAEFEGEPEMAEPAAPAQPAAAAPAMAPAAAPAAAPAPRQPAAPAPAAPAPAAAPAAPAAAPVQAMQAQAAAPAPTQAPAAPAPAAAPTVVPVQKTTESVPESTPLDTPEPVMADEARMQESQVQAADDLAMGATSSADAMPAKTVEALPTSTSTATATASPIPTATPQPTWTSTAIPAPTATVTSIPTATPRPTLTPTPAREPSPSPTASPAAPPTRPTAGDFQRSDEPESRPELPIRQLEIALGILLLVLIGVAVWISRRER